MSLQEVRSEFTEGLEGVQVQTECLKTQKRKNKESRLCSGSGVFTEDYGLLYVCSQASRDQSTQGPASRCPP